jgi:hypothetical protein
MSELVQKLSHGHHLVEVNIRPDRTPKALLKCIQNGFAHLKFPETEGGTSLYVALDMTETTTNEADFEVGIGSVELVGKLTLDYQSVKCKATIDLRTMSGRGSLQRLEQ